MESTEKQEAVRENEEVMEIKEVKAKGGIQLTVNIRQADFDRLAHMKEYFRHFQGIDPSEDVLIRWMTEFCMEALDESYNLCEPECVCRKIGESDLTKVVEDNPLVLPEVYHDDYGWLISYGIKRFAVEEIEEKYGDTICDDCWWRMFDGIINGTEEDNVSCPHSDGTHDDCPLAKGKE